MRSLYVCPLSRLPETLRASGARTLVSLLGRDATFQRPASIEPDDHLLLGMSDISTAREGHALPEPEQVRRLITFVARSDGPIVLHCFAGVSRSTAAAFVLACAHAPGRLETEIAAHLRALSPTATPNARIVQLGDDILGRNGRMAAAIAALGRGADCFEGVPFLLDLD